MPYTKTTLDTYRREKENNMSNTATDKPAFLVHVMDRIEGFENRVGIATNEIAGFCDQFSGSEPHPEPGKNDAEALSPMKPRVERSLGDLENSLCGLENVIARLRGLNIL